MKKLWETKTFEDGDGTKRRGKALAAFSQNFLTILLGAFLLMVLGILFVVLYTSNGGGDKSQSEQAFYDPNRTTATTGTTEGTEDAESSSAETSAAEEGQEENTASDSTSSSTSTNRNQSSENKTEEDDAEAQAAAQAQEAQAAQEAAWAAQQAQQQAIVPNGGVAEVYAGEGAASIAARAGISLEQLYALNPDKMIGPGGTWWANPGDVVYVD